MAMTKCNAQNSAHQRLLHLFNKGNAELAHGDLKSAYKSFHSALHEDSKVPEIHYNLGLVLHRMRRYAEAAESYQNSLSLNPNSDQPYVHLAICMEELGRGSDAFLYYDKCLLLNPNNSSAHHNLGLYLGK
ncbi:MAG: DUF3808 domain-containing protein, partial [Cytophagales bacterium]|nr:DUF3808 domain-containing protein [Armatimonadota bacterium]